MELISILLGFVWISCLLSIVLAAAMRIDFQSTWSMFFKDSSMPVWLSCTRKERRMPEGCVMNTFRTLNWASGATFLFSSVSFMSLLRTHHSGTRQVFSVVLQHPLLSLAMSLSLLYLLLFFGVSVALGTMMDREQAKLAGVLQSNDSAFQTEAEAEQLRAAAAADGLTHRPKATPQVPKEPSDHSVIKEGVSAEGSSPPAPPSSVCRTVAWLVDWCFVTAVAATVIAAPLLFLYALTASYTSGRESLEEAARTAPEWAAPFVPSPQSVPWLLLALLLSAFAMREAKTRQQLQDKVDTFASNARGSFTLSSSESTSAIAGTNLMLEMQAEQERLQSYTTEYPTGWYKLCDASELAPGEVKYVRCLGLHLAVFRGRETGTVAALDAFCPHLGANLAIGGQVEGDCLKCPFHEWQFNTSGAVSTIPYSDGALPKAGAVRYPTTEYAGMVLVFYDADEVKYNDLSKKSGQNACKDGAYSPKYQPPSMPELSNGGMTLRGSFKARVVNMPLVEFVLNAVDQAHFACLHSEMMIPWTSWVIPPPFNLITIDHESGWHCGADVGEEGHLSHFTDRAYLKWLGKRMPYTWARAVVDTTIIGPGGLVRFEFSIPDLGKIVLFETHTPLAHMKLRTEFRYFAEPAVPDILVAYVVGNWYSQWHQDLNIWENKRYLEKPLLVKGDGPFMKLRRWYKQFYPKSQPKIALGESAEQAQSAAPANATAAPLDAAAMF